MNTTGLRTTVFASEAPTLEVSVYADDGRTPNSRHPVLLYRSRATPAGSLAEMLEALFAANGWPPQWRGGVFDYHHYHSRSHETLGVAQGNACLILGGEQGESVEIGRGDVLVLPAGTGHCRANASADFELVAAYPPDQQDWDICRPDRDDPAPARELIETLARPAQDPVTGRDGALLEHWR